MNDDLDSMKDAYDEHYALDNKLMMEWYPERVVKMATGPSMLELGLGHGYSTAFFSRNFAPYRMLEGSTAMIERFRSRFRSDEVEIVQGYFESYETGDRFDNVAMGFILEHVDDPALILRRYRDFLQPGGSVFIAVPNSESLHRRFGHAAGLLDNLEHLSEVDRNFGHKRYFSHATLTHLVEESGYRVLRAEGIFLKPITTEQISALNLSPAVLQGMLEVGIENPKLCNALLVQAQPRQ